MSRYKIGIRRALYRMGIRDARLGRKPMNESAPYLRGYSNQYVREQIQSNTAPF